MFPTVNRWDSAIRMESNMAENSVVVNLNEYGKSRRTLAPTERLPLLHGCRDFLIEGSVRVLARQTEAMESVLLGMADRSPLASTRSAYFDAMRVLSKQSNELLAACKAVYFKSFDACISERGNAAMAESFELSIVGDGDFETTLALDKAASRLRFNCAEELLAIDTRMASLLGRKDLNESDNPLGPKVLCQALLDGISQISTEQSTQVVLLNQFDLALTTELARIYQSINHYLIDNGIVPDLKYGLKTRPHGKPPADLLNEQTTEAGSGLLDLFEKMARNQSGGSAAGSGAAVSAGTGGAAQHMVSGFNLLETLGRLQSGSASLPNGATLVLPEMESGSIQNVLRSLQQSPVVMQSASPLDIIMIDAVAMLFDVLFDESAIPDKLKAQIARLQIPVLKAAMMDRSFFSLRTHPVRRMLDAIALLSVRIPATQADSDRLEAISRIVTQVIDTFDQDTTVFETAADELEALDISLESTVEHELEPDIQALQQIERAELAPIVVHDFINRCLSEQNVAKPISDFLRKDWATLLMSDYVSTGEAGAHFNSHLETMRELAWSVQPKKDMDARLMLVRILPGLLKRLREGISSLNSDSERYERFFADLVVLHANAVRPNAQPVPLPEPSLDDLDAEFVLLADDATNAESPVATVTLVEPDAPEIEDEFMHQARNLVKADWVEFHYEDGTFRWMRLGWVGGVKHTYLFSDQDGLNSFSISQTRLAHKLRNGEAIVVERKSITESAFGKLMGMLRQQLGYA
jgi:hypothetical protein